MALEKQNLKPGNWLVVNCGKIPSESNCQLVILSPEDQKQDLIDAAAKHAVDKHQHEDNEELRKATEDSIEVELIAVG